MSDDNLSSMQGTISNSIIGEKALKYRRNSIYKLMQNINKFKNQMAKDEVLTVLSDKGPNNMQSRLDNLDIQQQETIEKITDNNERLHTYKDGFININQGYSALNEGYTNLEEQKNGNVSTIAELQELLDTGVCKKNPEFKNTIKIIHYKYIDIRNDYGINYGPLVVLETRDYKAYHLHSNGRLEGGWNEWNSYPYVREREGRYELDENEYITKITRKWAAMTVGHTPKWNEKDGGKRYFIQFTIITTKRTFDITEPIKEHMLLQDGHIYGNINHPGHFMLPVPDGGFTNIDQLKGAQTAFEHNEKYRLNVKFYALLWEGSAEYLHHEKQSNTPEFYKFPLATFKDESELKKLIQAAKDNESNSNEYFLGYKRIHGAPFTPYKDKYGNHLPAFALTDKYFHGLKDIGQKHRSVIILRNVGGVWKLDNEWPAKFFSAPALREVIYNSKINARNKRHLTDGEKVLVDTDTDTDTEPANICKINNRNLNDKAISIRNNGFKTIAIYIKDTEKEGDIKSAQGQLSTASDDIDEHQENIDKLIVDNNDTITSVQTTQTNLRLFGNVHKVMNKIGSDTETFINNSNNNQSIYVNSNLESNKSNKSNENNKINLNLLDKVKNVYNFFINNNIKEGMTETSSSILDYLQLHTDKIMTHLNRELSETDKVAAAEYEKYLMELLAQKDSALTDMLMDYMINNSEGSTAEKVYSKLSREQIEKVRKIKQNYYKTKTYKAYIHILKIIVFLTLILFVVLTLNRMEFLEKDITLTITIILIFLTTIYIFYRMYLLSMKDDFDFDKNYIPVDRKSIQNLKKTGKMYGKGSPLKNLGITCFGQECCDTSMVYDFTKNICTMEENFSNLYEKEAFVNIFFDELYDKRINKKSNNIIEPLNMNHEMNMLVSKSLDNTNKRNFSNLNRDTISLK